MAAMVAVLVAASSAGALQTAPANRWEPAIVAFEEADQTRMPAPGGVVFVGSSSIKGWNVEEYFSDFNPINRGFGGSQMSDIAEFVTRIVTPYKPAAVVVYSGDNDLGTAKTPAEIAGHFAQVVEGIRGELPDVPICLISIKPSGRRMPLIEKLNETNRLLREYVGTQSNVHYVDIAPLMLDEKGEPRDELFLEDRLHLSQAGYRVWSEALRPTLVKVIKQEKQD
jgi:lysophospholipase L1-like esterase